MTIQDWFGPSSDYFRDDFVVLGHRQRPDRQKMTKMMKISQNYRTNDLWKMTQMTLRRSYDYTGQIRSKLWLFPRRLCGAGPSSEARQAENDENDKNVPKWPDQWPMENHPNDPLTIIWLYKKYSVQVMTFFETTLWCWASFIAPTGRKCQKCQKWPKRPDQWSLDNDQNELITDIWL